MPLPEPAPGLVISFSYLWHSELAEGRDEGVKDRPCVVVLAVTLEGEETIVTVAPITHSAPRMPDEAIELPLAAKIRLGLDQQPSWIVTTELNRFAWPGPDLRPIPGRPGQFAYGSLSRALLLQVRDRIVALARDRRFLLVQRDEG